MRVVSRLLIATAFVALPRLLLAQSAMPAATPFQIEPASPVTQPVPAAQPAPSSADAPAATPAAVPAGPSMEAATAGIHAHVVADDHSADRHGTGLGTGGALMIVGGAALIIGLIIGGGAGLVVAIAGAALGLYGLFLFLQ
jgi:hypothetical protein